MKKFLTLFAIIATMLVTPMLSSCGGDDDEPDYKPEHPDTPETRMRKMSLMISWVTGSTPTNQEQWKL